MGSLRSLMRRTRPELFSPPKPTDEEVIQAICSGTIKQVKALLARGANPHATVADVNALRYAVGRGKLGMTRLLVRFGADVNQRCGDMATVLHLAVLSSHRQAPRICGVLLDSGADINAADFFGWTPLMEAAHQGNFAMAQLLVERGADPALMEAMKRSALDLVRRCKGSRAVRRLLKSIS